MIREEEEAKRETEDRLTKLLMVRDMGLLVSLGQDNIEEGIEALQKRIAKYEAQIELYLWLLNM